MNKQPTLRRNAQKSSLVLPIALAVLLMGGAGFAFAQLSKGALPLDPAAASVSQQSEVSSAQPVSASTDKQAGEEADQQVQEQAQEQVDTTTDATTDTPSEEAPAEEAVQKATDSASTSEASEAANQAPAAPAEAADLAWRDTDFALDPARQDWSFADNGRKVVYLTIDDGPSELTGQVLDILDKYNAKATFFVVGASPDHYHYIKEAYDRGHTIGLHTYGHDYAYIYSSPDAFFADLDQIGQVVQDQIGYVPCFMRFAGGSSNMVSANYSQGIMSTLVNSVQARGYQYYDWIASVGDGSVHTTEEIIGYAKEAPLEENIVLLCHDSKTKQTTVDALPAIIEYFQGLGYSFEAIDRSTWVCHHGVQN